ncbi:MAG: hypothetical protein K6G00_05070 [Treponema sp.]|nr:hypothetical protein [Treponema sp.]
MSEHKKKKGLGCLLSFIVFVIAIFIAWEFSKIQFNVHNYANGFDGDLSNSFFEEEQCEEPFFSEEDTQEIIDAVREMAQKLQMNILIYVRRTPLDDYDTESLSDEVYDEICGIDTDGVFYFLDMTGESPAYDYISTSGKAVPYYQEEIDNIFYRLDNYLPSSSDVSLNGYEPYRENIKEGIFAFLDALEHYASENKDTTYCYRSHSTGRYVFINNGTLYVTDSRPPEHKFYLIIAGLIFGCIVAACVNSSIRKKYRFTDSIDSAAYVSQERSSLTDISDNFIREYTTKRYNPPSSSSSGGRGGHSSGGSHGGGGHHR